MHQSTWKNVDLLWDIATELHLLLIKFFRYFHKNICKRISFHDGFSDDKKLMGSSIGNSEDILLFAALRGNLTYGFFYILEE